LARRPTKVAAVTLAIKSKNGGGMMAEGSAARNPSHSWRERGRAGVLARCASWEGRTARSAEPVDSAIRATHSCHGIAECGLLTEIGSAEGILAGGHANRINRPSTWLRDAEILLANPESSAHGAPKIIHDSVDSEFAPYLIRDTAGASGTSHLHRPGDNRKARQGDVRENLPRDEVRAVANLT
jgi:hypothetical protein